jgi:hypothetical protein
VQTGPLADLRPGPCGGRRRRPWEVRRRQHVTASRLAVTSSHGPSDRAVRNSSRRPARSCWRR